MLSINCITGVKVYTPCTHAGSTSGSSLQQQNLTCSNITCREGFYCKEDVNDSSVRCNPSCTWKQHPHATNIAIDFFVLTSVCIGVVSGVGVLVVAGIRWKNVYESEQIHCCIIKKKNYYYVPSKLLS